MSKREVVQLNSLVANEPSFDSLIVTEITLQSPVILESYEEE